MYAGFAHRPWSEVLPFALILLVASVPVALPGMLRTPHTCWSPVLTCPALLFEDLIAWQLAQRICHSEGCFFIALEIDFRIGC